jgi:hypothetical protein
MKNEPPMPQMPGMTSTKTPKGLAFIPTDEEMRGWLKQIEASGEVATENAPTEEHGERPAEDRPTGYNPKPENDKETEMKTFWHWGAHALLGVAVVVLGVVALWQYQSAQISGKALAFRDMEVEGLRGDLAKARGEAEAATKALDETQRLSKGHQALAAEAIGKLSGADARLAELEAELEKNHQAAAERIAAVLAAKPQPAVAAPLPGNARTAWNPTPQAVAQNEADLEAINKELAALETADRAGPQLSPDNPWAGLAQRRRENPGLYYYEPREPDYSRTPMRIEVQHIHP